MKPVSKLSPLRVRIWHNAAACLLPAAVAAGAGCAQAAPVPNAPRPNNSKPNIVVILVDDMGYSDIGCYGSEISTPNIDRLAQSGVRFTAFHNTARCCPTRASLLTGLYPHQAGVGHMTEEQDDAQGNTLPGYSGRLNESCVTIAEALHGAGYFTAMTGKWHLGQNHGVAPWNRGFDRTLTAAAGGFYFPDSPNAQVFLNGANLHRRDAPLPPQWYSTDLWTSYGLKFVDEARAVKKPFFLYLAHNAPHFPLQAPQEDIARWRGKYLVGWDKLRQSRYQRQVGMGLINKSWPLSPRPAEVPAWDSLTPAKKDRYDNMMAIYAAVVEHMDKSVGALVDGLRKRGELDNTLILFMSDNGGNAESGVAGRLEGQDPGGPQSTVFIGQSWAMLNNTPFVRYKHFTDEGGVATPLIAHWPRGIARARNGRLEAQPGHVIDIMATCLDVAGATYPRQFNRHPITPPEGTSLRPAFAGQPLHRAQPIFWEHEGNRAVLDGDWKLVALEGQPWRLYDTRADRTEQHDLAFAQPQRVQVLAAKWDAYAARSNVLPLGGWRGARAGQRAGRQNNLSRETRFSLKSGDHLKRAQSPSVAGRGFTITAKFNTDAPEGVIVAQGGLANGYALFLQNGKLMFLLRANGQATSVSTTSTVTGAHTAVAQLKAEGTLALALDGQPATESRAPGLVPTMPVDGIDVGSDEAGLVGPYTVANRFSGTIESVLIELDGAAPAAEGEE